MAKNNKKTGREYEILAKKMFEYQFRRDGDTVKVEQDVSKKGNIAEHQIDVYWEFKKGGFVYKAVVEAKDWESNVNQGEIFKFKCVLSDIPGQPRGIFVTRTGYQSGAIVYAAENGIELLVLRDINEKDWEGMIKKVNIESTIIVPVINKIDLIFDEKWISSEKIKNEIPENEKIPLIFGDNSKLEFKDGMHQLVIKYQELYYENFFWHTELYDENDKKLGILHDYIQNSSKELLKFNKPIFLKTTHKKLLKVKINAIKLELSEKQVTETSQLNIKDYIKYLKEDIISGDIEMFSEVDLNND